MKIRVALIDDHILIRKSLSDLLVSQGFEVILEASNGQDMIERFAQKHIPDVVLMDIGMPIMNGFESTDWITKNHPQVRVLALSMHDSEINIIKMLRQGAKGYLLKDCSPRELFNAINTVVKNDFYFSELVNAKLVTALSKGGSKEIFQSTSILNLTPREMVFIKHCCTELSYKQIAAEMSITPKTAESYREDVFVKCGVKTRVGLVMYAVKRGLV